MKWWKRPSIFAMVFAALLQSCLWNLLPWPSNNAHAFELDRTVTLYRSSGGQPYYSYSTNANCTGLSSYVQNAGTNIYNTGNLSCMSFRDAYNTAYTYSKEQFFVVEFDVMTVGQSYAYDAFNVQFATPTGTVATQNKPVSLELLSSSAAQSFTENQNIYHNFYRAIFINESGGNAPLYAPIKFSTGTHGNGSYILVAPVWWGIFEQYNLAKDATLVDILNEIKRISGNYDQKAITDAINQGNQQAHQDAQATQDAINKGNQQQQQQWEKEENEANSAIEGDNGNPDMGAQEEQANGYFGIFTSIFDAANSTSCLLPEIEAFGFSLGRLDLCAFKPPAWVQGALGAVATIAVAWCGIRVIKRVVQVATGSLN